MCATHASSQAIAAFDKLKEQDAADARAAAEPPATPASAHSSTDERGKDARQEMGREAAATSPDVGHATQDDAGAAA